MNLGTQSRSKLIAAAVLMLLAVVLVGRMLVGSGTPLPVSPAPVATAASINPSRTAPRRGKGPRTVALPRSIDPSLRYEWLKASEDTKYEGNGRNIFLAQAEIPKPNGNGTSDGKKVEPAGPPLPPPPPPINLKFYGFASRPGEAKKVFLSEGEDVFIASEGEIVDRRYKVLHISPVSLEIEDVLSNNRQMIPLTQS